MNRKLPLVVVTHTLPDGWLASLEGKCDLVIGPWDATQFSQELLPSLGEAEGLFCLLTIRVGRELLQQAPRLRVVSNMAVGYDNIDVAACTERGIPVGNTPGVLTEGTADLTMTLLLAAARRIVEANLDARQGRWKTWSPAGWLGADLYGATLGIVGAGKIGKAVAERGRAFGMQVIYCDPQAQGAWAERLPAEKVEFGELLERSDFVSLHTPLSSETHALIDEAALRRMKPNSILINTSRGAVVDQNALEQALREGWITAAALDVTTPEPLPPEHPLFSLPNCLIVPHIGSATRNTRRRMAELACANLLAGLNGERLPHTVNPEVYQDH